MLVEVKLHGFLTSALLNIPCSEKKKICCLELQRIACCRPRTAFAISFASAQAWNFRLYLSGRTFFLVFLFWKGWYLPIKLHGVTLLKRVRSTFLFPLQQWFPSKGARTVPLWAGAGFETLICLNKTGNVRITYH